MKKLLMVLMLLLPATAAYSYGWYHCSKTTRMKCYGSKKECQAEGWCPAGETSVPGK